MESLFYPMFGVCFSCFAFRTAFSALQSREGKFAEDRRLCRAASVAMLVLWFTWFYTVFDDPFGIHLPEGVRYMGLAVFVTGVLLVMASHVRLEGFKHEGMLVTGGIYSKIRNPMYLGFILWMLGLPIFMQALFTLVSAGLWVPQILYWKYTEEKDLEKRYSDYAEYKSRTWF
jgi:protein-S-isoprenylcysteine O-methyltransferase Ste14